MTTKKTFFKSSLLLLLSIPVLITSCKKDDPAPVSNTITDVVVNNPNFSTLEAAVIKANLQATLSGTGPFTVFAPDNAAFAASGITAATLNSLTNTQVSNILL